MLFPRESETREVKDLSGLWAFKVDWDGDGAARQWPHRPLSDTRPMPVPASYNDLTQDAAVRDHVGTVWYERRFFVPAAWQGRRIALRVGAAAHRAVVWVNGRPVAEHKGGFLPFEADISEVVELGQENRVTLSVNNVLDWTTLPTGQVLESRDEWHPAGFKVQGQEFDFFNYSGLHRPVRLVVTPRIHVSDVRVVTDIRGTDGLVDYTVEVAGGAAAAGVRLLDAEGREVAAAAGAQGRLAVANARLWEPGNAYLYTLEITLADAGGERLDVYRLPVGIRTVRVTDKAFLINGKPFYFRGFGKHEDSDLRGKGLDHAVNVKDFNLMAWMGANSFRTSHYPYSEELMDLADRQGLVVIDEVPAVGMSYFADVQKVFIPERINGKTLAHHLETLRELVRRDKNHPCVVMWSVANEARTDEEGAVPYFKRVAEEARALDATRPITIVGCLNPGDCRVADFFDVICVNRYFSWYSDSGHLELVERQVEHDLRRRYELHRKPVLVTEFGADAVAGLHQHPPLMFSEEYQAEFLAAFGRAFDRLDFLIGEHVWCFADFATGQNITRVIGNKKGVFTRQRQPKAAAFTLRERWLKAGNVKREA
ncbi:MAG: beta-glucuronidase [Lentisphaeria bacterium]